MTVARFPLGQIVATPGALAALEEAADNPASFLRRHVTGDWGELDEDDRKENEISVEHSFRLLSSYTLSNGTKLWVITEANRSATTLLLPSEYGWPPNRHLLCLFFLGWRLVPSPRLNSCEWKTRCNTSDKLRRFPETRYIVQNVASAQLQDGRPDAIRPSTFWL